MMLTSWVAEMCRCRRPLCVWCDQRKRKAGESKWVGVCVCVCVWVCVCVCVRVKCDYPEFSVGFLEELS